MPPANTKIFSDSQQPKSISLDIQKFDNTSPANIQGFSLDFIYPRWYLFLFCVSEVHCVDTMVWPFHILHCIIYIFLSIAKL